MVQWIVVVDLTENLEIHRFTDLPEEVRVVPIELRTVYPLIAGLGAEEGFEAYVFTNANILTGTNYDCDDTNTFIDPVKKLKHEEREKEWDLEM